MTAGDWLASAVLAAFVAAALAGWLKWVFRALAGGALGAVLLIALGQVGQIPGASGVSELLGQGRITPAMTDGAARAAVALGVDFPADRVDQSAAGEAQPKWRFETFQRPESPGEALQVREVPDPGHSDDRRGR